MGKIKLYRDEDILYWARNENYGLCFLNSDKTICCGTWCECCKIEAFDSEPGRKITKITLSCMPKDIIIMDC